MGLNKYGEIPHYTNKILASLPINSRAWLETLEPVALAAGAVLHEPDEAIEHVYFLNDALVSILSAPTASSACNTSGSSTKANPREAPVSKSRITCTVSTLNP